LKILIDTYLLLKRMGLYKAYTTLEIVDVVKKQRCAVLKRLHRLSKAGYLEFREGKNQTLYWKVVKIPDKPKPPRRWKESKSLAELAEEEKLKNDV